MSLYVQAHAGPKNHPAAESACRSALNHRENFRRAEQAPRAASSLVPTVSFQRLKPCKGDEYDPRLVDEAADLRNSAKKQLEKLKSDYFSRTPEQHLESLREMKPVIQTLVQLVLEYGRRFAEAKKEKAIVDFSWN